MNYGGGDFQQAEKHEAVRHLEIIPETSGGICVCHTAKSLRAKFGRATTGESRVELEENFWVKPFTLPAVDVNVQMSSNTRRILSYSQRSIDCN